MTILTVTLNPAIDIAYQLDHLALGSMNRVSKLSKTAGGKGLNVSRVLDELGADVIATGFADRRLGTELIRELEGGGISCRFTRIIGRTRNCIAILHAGMQTEILEKGPTILKEEKEAFLQAFEKSLGDVEAITMSGSLPAGLDPDFYSQLVKLASQRNKPVLVDISGLALEALVNAEIKPTLIKPNIEEFSMLLGLEIGLENVKEALNEPLFDGIDWIVISLGKAGTIARVKGELYRVRIPEIAVINPVGSGDASVAGLAFGMTIGASIEDCLKLANVCGMLNAQEAQTGHINMEHFPELFEQIKVEKI
ncbi:hexose kinase [Lactococcus termiticola]|uniref:Tagatose-6-phosphate kinase n=1 Tax=Lactococcus termiticola TaxID=2169526 RepID=A0A2R5HG72_9LACT|nr:hexose kinase [Lactococcus termiticola]GBG96325.1 tagatose-6-phosphate kinase [Lactococcus termiticola]